MMHKRSPKLHDFSNHDIAEILDEMAIFWEMEGVEWKPTAYKKASQSVGALAESVSALYLKGGRRALDTIPGVGESIAEHIADLFTKGTFTEYARFKKKYPMNVEELTAIEGVGAKKVKVLWQKLKIKTLNQLEKAAKMGKIGTLAHFGKKTEANILRGIEFFRKSHGRLPLGSVLPMVRGLEAKIRDFPEVHVAIVAGSIRRRKDTIGDIDILAISDKPKEAIERFVALPEIRAVYAKGKDKVNVRLKNNLDADLRVLPEQSFGAALNYLTGSKAHNIALREVAMKKGLKLNEYGLWKGEQFVAGRTEEELYHALGYAYVEPELREMTGELEAAKLPHTNLPNLIGYDDLRGDLQVQTNWTDGESSIETMVDAAIAAGLEYIAITDHTKSLAMTGGADEQKLRKQMAAIDALNIKLKKDGKRFTVLKGAEVNIMADGTLDIADDVLAELDVVGAAVHSHFSLSRTLQTQRIIRAMENPHVDIIFHLTGRLIGKREPIDMDIDAIIAAAKQTGTVLEINAFPDRLDLQSEYIRKCVNAGVKMSIDSDAHSTAHFHVLEHGIGQARRGWAKKDDIINTHHVAAMRKLLKGTT